MFFRNFSSKKPGIAAQGCIDTFRFQASENKPAGSPPDLSVKRNNHPIRIVHFMDAGETGLCQARHTVFLFNPRSAIIRFAVTCLSQTDFSH
jgi:hypothetical protein